MKNLYKAALLAALGLAGVSAGQAATYPTTGELLVGFTTQSGNDLVYDLGTAGSLTDGQVWHLSSFLTGNLSTFGNLYWGVIGDIYTGPSKINFTTTAVGSTADQWSGSPQLSNINLTTKGLVQNFTAIGIGESLSIDVADELSWNKETITGNAGQSYVLVFANPNVVGETTANFWAQNGTATDPVLLGSFSFSGGDLTYNAAPVPEPSTYSLLAGAGLLAFVLRNKLTRKQA